MGLGSVTDSKSAYPFKPIDRIGRGRVVAKMSTLYFWHLTKD
jgi:hypothetical protein